MSERRTGHWTDAVFYVCGLIGALASLAAVFGLIYLSHNHWHF